MENGECTGHSPSIQPSHSFEINSSERASGFPFTRREGKRQGQGNMQWYDSMTVYEGQWEDDIQVEKVSNSYVLIIFLPYELGCTPLSS